MGGPALPTGGAGYLGSLWFLKNVDWTWDSPIHSGLQRCECCRWTEIRNWTPAPHFVAMTLGR